MLEGDEQLAIFEAGISKPGEMERLERIIRPDVVIFTSIGDAHQEHFLNLEQKCVEKMVLAHGASKIIYHSYYEPLGRLIAARFRFAQVYDAASFPLVPESVVGNEASRRNAQIVEAFCAAMGYPAPAFASAPEVAMRLEVKDGINDSVLINDAYNLDLNSLALALDYLHTVAPLAAEDPHPVGYRAERTFGRRTLQPRGGHGGPCGHRYLRRHRSEAEALRRAHYLQQDFFPRPRSASSGWAAMPWRDGPCCSRAPGSTVSRSWPTPSRKSHTTVLEVDLDAMIHNLNYFRSKLAHGHEARGNGQGGLLRCRRFRGGADAPAPGCGLPGRGLCRRGVLLRERGITMPIVVLNADADSFELMIANRLEPEIYSFRSLTTLRPPCRMPARRAIRIHLKLDTGMHRLGFMEEEIGRFCELLPVRPEVKVATIFFAPELRRHARGGCLYAGADRPLRPDEQRHYGNASSYPVIRHMANSAAIERFPEAQYDMCRLGLGLYGFGWCHNEALRPISTLRTRIVAIKHLAAGETVGYGRPGT